MRFYSVVFVAIIFCALVMCSGCIQPSDEPILPDRGFFMGLLPTPAQGQDFEEVYAQAAEYCEFVPVWSSGAGAQGFWDFSEKLSGWWGQTFVDGLIRDNGMFPILHFSFIDRNSSKDLVLKTPEYLPDATLSDEEWQTLYVESVIDCVRVCKPAFVSTGNEVNRWFEAYGAEPDDPNGFQHFVSLHEKIYDAVKAVSPETKVFCVFSREIVEQYREADMSVLLMFDSSKLDMLMLTSYPYAVSSVNRPSDIPVDYYAEASSYLPGLDFGFSELGWSSLEVFGGEVAQADFLVNASSVLTVDQGLDLKMFGYCWLHDLDGNDTVGLISYEGVNRQAYEVWKQLSEST